MCWSDWIGQDSVNGSLKAINVSCFTDCTVGHGQLEECHKSTILLGNKFVPNWIVKHPSAAGICRVPCRGTDLDGAIIYNDSQHPPTHPALRVTLNNSPLANLIIQIRAVALLQFMVESAWIGLI